jgi:type II secretory ATPase GspE/PulE/Tfp pilus assembly ATPase PilB-like protein
MFPEKVPINRFMTQFDFIEHEQLFVPWAMWLTTVVAWVASCLYLDSFRLLSSRSAGRCRTLLVGFGPLYFLGTVLVGGRIVGVGGLALAGLIGVALRYGNHLQKFQERFLGGSLGETSGSGDFIKLLSSKIGAWLHDPDSSILARAPEVLLFKKDGSVYGGKNLSRDQSYAMPRARKLFEAAEKYGATDIHLEPKDHGGLQVRYRVDGLLQSIEKEELPAQGGPAVLALLKVLSDMDIAERRRPQDGSFAVTVQGRRFDIRSATSPTQFGEKMVMRVLDASGAAIRQGLDSGGMPPEIAHAIREIIHRSQGMLIVCGPTGSGKTTTVYSALGEIDQLSRNIVTIEDPIEYQLQGISQIAVNTAADVTFATILRSVLRQDPDVVLVGEVRDRETAETAMRAALTGHLVLTTIHANDAPTTITRLIDMGVDASLIQSTVSGVIAQRLVRILCPLCKKAYRTPENRRGLDDSSNGLDRRAPKEHLLYKAVGCSGCLGTGYRGRTGVFEFMTIDARIRKLLAGKPSIEAIRQQAKHNGMITLRGAVKNKVIQGITSAAEAQRVIV